MGPKQAERLRQVTEEAIAAYNAKLGKPNGKLPAVHLVNPVREAQVRRCLSIARSICQRQYGVATVGPRFWADYFTVVDSDPFHSGRQPGGKGHEGWKPDFDFLTQPRTMTRLFDRAVDEAGEG